MPRIGWEVIRMEGWRPKRWQSEAARHASVSSHITLARSSPRFPKHWLIFERLGSTFSPYNITRHLLASSSHSFLLLLLASSFRRIVLKIDRLASLHPPPASQKSIFFWIWTNTVWLQWQRGWGSSGTIIRLDSERSTSSSPHSDRDTCVNHRHPSQLYKFINTLLTLLCYSSPIKSVLTRVNLSQGSQRLHTPHSWKPSATWSISNRNLHGWV